METVADDNGRRERMRTLAIIDALKFAAIDYDPGHVVRPAPNGRPSFADPGVVDTPEIVARRLLAVEPPVLRPEALARLQEALGEV